MTDLIHEVILTTRKSAREPTHIAPMGIRHDSQGRVVVAPFRPSRTLENLLASGVAVVNRTDDVRIFAGCVTGRTDWPLRRLPDDAGERLEAALSHQLLELEEVEEDEIRPRCLCGVARSENHAPFQGFNRAQAAVLEAAVLVSRLDRLPREKVRGELEYLRIAIDKTAGEKEAQAWSWLLEKIERETGIGGEHGADAR